MMLCSLNERLLRQTCILLLMSWVIGFPLFTIHAQSSLPEDVIWIHYDIPTDQIAISSDGDVWAVILGRLTDYSGMVYFDGDSWSDVPQAEKLVGTCWTNASLAIASDGTVWLGACGPNHFDGESWTVYISSLGGGGIFRDMEELKVIVNEQDAPPSNGVATLATASDGSLWLVPDGAGVGGVLHFDGEVWVTYTADDGLISNRVHTLAISPDDSVWIGSSEGLSHFDGESWTNYPQAAGLQAVSLEKLVVTPDGMVWGTTSMDGENLFWFDGQEITTLDSPEILDARRVLTLAVAPDGMLWVGTDRGVSKYDGNNWTNYRLERTSVCTGGFLPSLAIAPDGSVWYGTSCGIYRLMPQQD